MKGWRGNEKREKDGSVGRLIASIWLSYRYGSHKNQKSVSDEKLSEVCQTGGIRKLGYFKWWVMSDENWVRSDEWWKKKKNQIASSHFLWDFTSCSLVEWPLLLFLHLFLLFLLSHSWHQITIMQLTCLDFALATFFFLQLSLRTNSLNVSAPFFSSFSP